MSQTKQTNKKIINSKSSKDLDVEINKGVAALSYVWVLCLVPLLGKKDSEFAQHHAKQGFIVFTIEILGSLVFWIPLFGWILAVALFVVAVMGVIKALNGEWWEIPLIYDWSKKINL